MNGEAPRRGLTRTLAKESERRLTRRSVTEEDFHSVDGWPYAGRRGRRSCVGCGELEPRRRLWVRHPDDGRTEWLPVPDALARGGR